MSRNNTKLKLRLRLSNERLKGEIKMFDMSQKHLEICEKELIRVNSQANKKIIELQKEGAELAKRSKTLKIALTLVCDKFSNMSFLKRVKFLFGRL